jgi:hypothetical protein
MTGKKIKIALCLSGEPRSSMFCFPYIYESFINLGPKYEVNTYIHSWKNFRSLPLYSPKLYKIEPNKPQQIKSQIPPPYNTSHYQNHTLMYYGIKECINLIEDPYDIYIRCRLDLMFESKLVLFPIFLDILNSKYDMFSLHSDYPTKSLNGIDDQIIISNFKGIKSLSNYFNQLMPSPISYFEKVLKEEGHFYAEGFLRNYLNKQDIKVVNNPLSNYRLVRSSQFEADKPFDFLDQ